MNNLHASTSTQQGTRKEPGSISASSSIPAQDTKQKELIHMLEIICKSSPAILQTAIDEFVRTPKGSDAAVREANKIELALTHNSNPNPSPPIFSHLSKAIRFDRPWLFKKLLNHSKIDINHASKSGWPPIFHAIRGGNVPAFQQLMEKDAKVSSEAATWAAMCGREEMLAAILARVPESEISSETRENLAHEAEIMPINVDMFKRQSSAERRKWLQGVWDGIADGMELTMEERLSGIMSALLAGMEPNMSYRKENKPLHLAAAKFINEPMPIRILLNEGANPDSQNDDGDTPTSIAVQNNNLPALKELLDAGANPNLANRKGDTPLVIAASNNNIEAHDALLAAGADPNRANPIVTG